MKTIHLLPRTLLSLLLCTLAAAVPAQTAGTKSIGTGKGGKLLTKEELRACFAMQKDLAARKAPLEADRASLDRERDELKKIDDSLQADRAAIEKLTQTAADVGKRSQELNTRLAAYNERTAKFESAVQTGLSGPSADRQRRQLDNEKAALDKATAELEADRKAIGPQAEQKAKTYDARVSARDAAATDWNARNTKMAQAGQAYESDLQVWKTDCEGRSYREDDEKALQAGK